MRGICRHLDTHCWAPFLRAQAFGTMVTDMVSKLMLQEVLGFKYLVFAFVLLLHFGSRFPTLFSLYENSHLHVQDGLDMREGVR